MSNRADLTFVKNVLGVDIKRRRAERFFYNK